MASPRKRIPKKQRKEESVGAMVSVIMEHILRKGQTNLRTLADELFDYRVRALTSPHLDYNRAIEVSKLRRDKSLHAWAAFPPGSSVTTRIRSRRISLQSPQKGSLLRSSPTPLISTGSGPVLGM